nr:hypothetical protein Iba_chr04cCG19530 [Ipomoea batatas]
MAPEMNFPSPGAETSRVLYACRLASVFSSPMESRRFPQEARMLKPEEGAEWHRTRDIEGWRRACPFKNSVLSRTGDDLRRDADVEAIVLLLV